MHPGNGNEQQRMMIVLFGPPASGKSTLATTLFKDFTWIHQDTLKTLAKCKQKALEVLKEEKNQHVVVDSTNRSVQTRHEWIELSKKIAHVQVVCVHLDIEKPLCMHLNVYRGLTGGQKVPDVAIHTFYKSMEIPQV
jgi:bifunctional polynucleotide phosphatase/kinase